MIRKLIRSDLLHLKKQTLRGGHGWDRPDVPLSLNYPYKHKREVFYLFLFKQIKISIYETNLWFYDQSQPEYFINNNE